MKYAPVLAAILCLAAACSDDPQKPAGAPTAPPSALNSAAGAPASLRASTVCVAFARDRALVKASLNEIPDKGATEKETALGERLTRKLESLDALIKDACN